MILGTFVLAVALAALPQAPPGAEVVATPGAHTAATPGEPGGVVSVDSHAAASPTATDAHAVAATTADGGHGKQTPAQVLMHHVMDEPNYRPFGDRGETLTSLILYP